MKKKLKLNVVKIDAELKRIDWTQADLARAIGARRQYISKLLKTQRCSFGMVEKIADALGFEPKDLLI